ncbi:MAG: NAD(+) synthase [Candidatus Brocadiae bacterium]|nr:NAD(+) synthase [Candidatus Brocadiia bacterium]
MKIDLLEMCFFRVAVVSPALRLADVKWNEEEICKSIDKCKEQNCSLVLFPELCLTGYTCADLFYQPLLIEKATEALFSIARYTQNAEIAVVVGCPIAVNNTLLNCAVFLSQGEIVGIVPKSYLPNTNEFYEKRWFASGKDQDGREWHRNGKKIPIGTDLLFQHTHFPDCLVGIEICEDLWSPCPPSIDMCLRGATLILNPSASNEILGKSDFRRLLVQSQSGRCLSAYCYASSGAGESTTDLVFSGHCMIAENAMILEETTRFSFDTQIAIADIDIQKLVNERRKSNNFSQPKNASKFRIVEFGVKEKAVEKLFRSVSCTPFVPREGSQKKERCQEIFSIQSTALARRIMACGCTKVVLGISGGMDSTLALLVCAKAFDILSYSRKGICAITMPGFGTTSRTRSNAESLSIAMGATLSVVSIHKAVEQHFLDIGHDPKVQDITYENAQARERMQILMDIANKTQAIVVGTGDMSELALGWCTYNGDHISMYGVNAGIPKTLVRTMIEWASEYEFSGDISRILQDIAATPISPELLPPDEKGEILQKTEEKIGPYLLHDFFLYHAIRFHCPPKKVYVLAKIAFENKYNSQEILKYLKIFYQRFFSQQFKRSCMPDGPKIGTVSLSPRGDLRFPSDSLCTLWIKELENL